MEVEPEIIVEEGEISDDTDVEYTPLERPPTLINSHRAQIHDILSDDESEVSSDSDSDAGFSNRPKRIKLKAQKITEKPTNKIKKYDIWSSRVQEDVLAETLISCDVSKIDRSRFVESYDYSLAPRYNKSYDHEKRYGNKRKHSDRKNIKLRLGKRDNSTDEDTKGLKRNILDLVTTIENSSEEIAKDIANKLCEEKDNLINKIVSVLGKHKSITLFNKTKEIEEDGGMLVMNGTRRRTPGGVYIFLLKRDDDVTLEQQNEIFSEEKLQHKNVVKCKKRGKYKKIKKKLMLAKEKLPKLLTRAELSVKDMACNEIVGNPPPSPASEEHDSNINHKTVIPSPAVEGRNIPAYSEDFLDIGVGNDMDMF